MTEDSALEDLLAPIRDRHRPRLLARLAHVRQALVGKPPVVTEDLRADLHALIGALGTLGWSSGSVLVTDIQQALINHALLQELVAPLDALILQVAGNPPAKAQPAGSGSKSEPGALVASPSPETTSARRTRHEI